VGPKELITEIDPLKRTEGQKSVTLIGIERTNGMRTSCTGVYLSSTVLATTATCLHEAKTVRDFFTNHYASEVRKMPEFLFEDGKVPADFINHNIALVKFPKPVYLGKVWEISFETVDGANPRIFSYGKPFLKVSNDQEIPVLRSALIDIFAYTGTDYISYKYPHLNPSDAGAPILDSNARIVGLASFDTSPEAKSTYERLGSDTNVYRTRAVMRYLNFYSGAIQQGYDLPKITCTCDQVSDGKVFDTFTITTLNAHVEKGTTCNLYEDETLKYYDSPKTKNILTSTLKNCRSK
jgi:hypothetical protein